MVELVKFVYVMITLLSIVVVAKNSQVTFFYFYFLITTGNKENICFKDADCPQDICSYPFKPKCNIYGYCSC
ncbi:Nodule Cysteine-Rich (NCR) secreted peptide [Medicago truncatula]|uniref:Nodule Cysteine-Rich (NCR) secreted peptide n=1 Tax=Medicago truncatula TaxID=3880 RepID=G7LE02_MEDTR|nr:Nodule Cysteine-Rich (NCR) secreted peptide [Medicago truncatula]